jgi:hypothetical protein
MHEMTALLHHAYRSGILTSDNTGCYHRNTETAATAATHGSSTSSKQSLHSSSASSNTAASSIQPHCVYAVHRVQQVSAQATRYKDAITLQMIELCSTVSSAVTVGQEWGGAWSRGCPLWNEYPEIAEHLQVSALTKPCVYSIIPCYCLLISFLFAT